MLSNDDRVLLRNRGNKFKKRLKEKLLNDTVFFDAVTSSTGDKKMVLCRHGAVEDLIKTVITE